MPIVHGPMPFPKRTTAPTAVIVGVVVVIDDMTVDAVVVDVEAVDVVEPAGLHLYVSPSQTTVVASTAGLYSGESGFAQFHPCPVVGWTQTYVWWSEGHERLEWQPLWWADASSGATIEATPSPASPAAVKAAINVATRKMVQRLWLRRHT